MKHKKIIALALSMVLGVACLCGIPAFADDTVTEIKDPSTFKYPVPDGLPVIDITDGQYMLANSYNGIGCYYVKNVAGFETQGIDATAYYDLCDMIYACRSAGYQIYINSGYRSWEWQIPWWQNLILYYYNNDSYAAAQEVLPPGCNEHQLGLAVDLTCDLSVSSSYSYDRSELDDGAEVFNWLNEHCAEYGFIQRYPEGKEEYYGVSCCPNHYRYVGKEAAEYIMDNDLCLEEFLMLYGLDVKLPADAKAGS